MALIGENGAGKTTILNCLAGSIYITDGSIIYQSEDLLQNDSRRGEFGFLIQADFFEYMNAYDNLNILYHLSGRRNRMSNRKDILRLLALVGLEDKKDSFVKTFSFGMKQRLGLAQALLNNPHFPVLDEPFAGLDPIGKKIMKKVILDKAQKEGAGILFTSHDLEDVIEICDRVVMLKKGRITYNDIFRPAKDYILCMSGETEAEQLAGAINSATRQGNHILCRNFEDFQSGYREAANRGLRIQDIDVRQDGLYIFLKEGMGMKTPITDICRAELRKMFKRKDYLSLLGILGISILFAASILSDGYVGAAHQSALFWISTHGYLRKAGNVYWPRVYAGANLAQYL